MRRKDNCHAAQLLMADQFKSAKNVAFVFDEKFGIRRDAKETFSQGILLNPAANARAVQFLPDLLYLRPIVGRKQHLHISSCACFTVALRWLICNSGQG